MIAIKAGGGMSLVQDPAEAIHDSMPETAIEHDNVDGILTISELAEELPRLAAGADLRPRHRRADAFR